MKANNSVWKNLVAVALVVGAATASAQVPKVLLEACEKLQPAAKRFECLQAAQQGAGGRGLPANVNGKTYGTSDAPSTYQPPPQSPAAAFPVTPVLPLQSQGGYAQPGAAPGGYPQGGNGVCHVGPRGGTYTITPSGRKNYGGC